MSAKGDHCSDQTSASARGASAAPSAASHAAKYARRAAPMSVADLRVVPSLVSRLVRAFFPKERERWVLLDWSGQFAEAYDFVPASSNIVVINRLGSVVHKANGRELEQNKLKEISNELRKLMRE
jgi:hypothetical protein